MPYTISIPNNRSVSQTDLSLKRPKLTEGHDSKFSAQKQLMVIDLSITVDNGTLNVDSADLRQVLTENDNCTMAQMAHFSFPYYFTIPNSEICTTNFGIVKYI